jgi:hypothetical protein
MNPEIQVLHKGTFHKSGCPDVHICMWRRGPDELYVDVEEEGRARTDTWPAIGSAPVSDVELLVRYEQELRRKGYGPGEWGQAGLPLLSNSPAGK